MSQLKLYLFSSPRLEQDEAWLKIGRRKATALLAYLAVSGESQPRERLATLLWPDSDPTRAYSYLRRELALLNKALGEGWLEADRDCVALIQRDDFWLDVAHFRHLLAACDRHGHPEDEVCPECMPLLSQAVALYRGDFMDGFSLLDSPNFEEWQLFESEDLRRELIGALGRLVQGHTARGEFEAAIRHARHWLALDPWHEAAHRQLMQLYAWTGDQAGALRQYQECAQLVQEELGQPPEEATRTLYEAIKTQQPPEPPLWAEERRDGRKAEPTSDGLVDLSALPHLPAAKHNLPSEVTRFVGREQELAEIRQLLLDEASCRLLTLVGPGGIGKSRLAIQAASQALDAFPDGVYLVYLAPISSAQFLVPAIADAVNLSFQGRAAPRTQLLNYLREKDVLLVLDNLEHVLTPPERAPEGTPAGGEIGGEVVGVDLLSDILANAPGVKIMATSRERLNLQGEWVREVRGLTYPSAAELEMVSGAGGVGWEDYSALRLFVERAHHIHPEFSLSEADEPALVRICQLVEGMPLALELASAWIRLMPCCEIEAEIRRNLDFLTSSLRDIPERHRSLRALFEHSWQLLTEPERTVVKKLSVFQGGFEREAAEQVTGASLPQLAALADKSILRTRPSGRYDMHGILRQYAGDKMEKTPDDKKQTQDEHCAYYMTFLHQRERHLQGPGQRQALAEIMAAIDEVRAAWRWAVAQGKTAEIGQGLEGLYLFYHAQGWVQEGEEVFRQAAEALEARSGAQPDLVLGQLLARQGRFTYRLGLYRETQDLLQESLEIFDQLEAQGHSAARREKAFSLYCLGAVVRADGEYQQARQECQESLALYRESDDRPGMAEAFKLLGIIAGSLGDYDEARQQLHEALALYRAIDDQYGIANTLNDLGIVADRRGEYAEAKRLYQECVAIRQQIDHRWGIGLSLSNLGYLAYRHGRYAEAKPLFEESLVIQRDIGDQYNIANCLSNLGAAECALGEYDAARRHFTESLRFSLEVGAVPLVLEVVAEIAGLLTASQPAERERAAQLYTLALHHPASDKLTQETAERELAELATDLPPEAMTAAREKGKTSKLELVVAEILGEAHT